MKPSSLPIQPSTHSNIQSNSLPSFQLSSLLSFHPSSTNPQSLEQVTFWQQSLNRHCSVQCTQLYCIVPRCTKQHNTTLLLAKLHYAALSCTAIRWTLLHHYIVLHLARGCTETGCRHFTIKIFEMEINWAVIVQSKSRKRLPVSGQNMLAGPGTCRKWVKHTVTSV